MNRLWLLLIASALLLGGCSVNMGKDARFGMFGGKQAEPKPEPPFDINSTLFGTRWFPTHVRWAPDDSHLLVSLCHVNRVEYCRIGKYWVAENRWELLNLQPRITYRWPSYSPDGKHIVASVGGCDENYRCPERRYALVLLTSDAKRTIKLADTIANYPSFSDDGKKIIYWRWNGGMRGMDVAQFDLSSGKEQMLTKFSFWGTETKGAPFFLPGGERFVFSGRLPIHHSGEFVRKDGKIVYQDGKAVLVPHPLDGTKLDFNGPNRNMIRYVADIRQGVVTKDNVSQVTLLWPDGISGPGGGVVDISRNGEILYHCYLGCRKAKQANGTLEGNTTPANIREISQTGLLLLRPATEDEHDVAAFSLPFGAQIASLSKDGLRIAFGEANPISWHHSRRFGITTLGNAPPTFIDWPRLELDPAATQPIATKNGVGVIFR